MRDSAYLIFNKKGLRRMVKGQPRGRYGPKTRPALDAGEYAVHVTVSVPDAVFKPQPTPEATITVPEAAIIAPAVAVSVEMPSGEVVQ